MNRLAPVLAMALLLFASLTMAGPEKVAFPPYQSHVLYAVVDRPDIKEVRDVYATPEGWEYALFRPAGSRNEQANIKACFQCHKPKSGQDFLLTFSQLVSAPK